MVLYFLTEGIRRMININHSLLIWGEVASYFEIKNMINFGYFGYFCYSC